MDEEQSESAGDCIRNRDVGTFRGQERVAIVRAQLTSRLAVATPDLQETAKLA